MEAILTAVIPVVIIGVICAAVLVIASKVMAVKEDERFPKVRECLPGANCGACGFAGCDGYAKALCENPDTPTNLCIPGADGVSRQLSEVLGVEFADVVEQVAVVHCSGDCAHTQDKVQYESIESCTAAKLMYGGKGSCTYGCLGLGDCAKVCPQDAVCVDNGVARINPKDCVGCRGRRESRRRVQQQGQGRRHAQGLLGRLHWLQEVREGLSPRRDQGREQRRGHRLRQMPRLPRLRRLREKLHHRMYFNRGFAGLSQAERIV